MPRNSLGPALEIQKHAREKSSINSAYEMTQYDTNGAHLNKYFGFDINDLNIEFVD